MALRADPVLTMELPPVTLSLERAAAWSWRLLVCTAALALVGALLWYLRVIVLPIAVALTLAPALSPLASWFRRRRHLERPAAALALLDGSGGGPRARRRATVSVVEQFDELRAAVLEGVEDIAGQLQDEPIGLSGALTDDLESSLGDAWREASGYAAAGVQTGAGIVAGVVLAVAMLYFVLRDGAAPLGRDPAQVSAPTSGPRSIVPAGARGTCSAASCAERRRSRRSTRC